MITLTGYIPKIHLLDPKDNMQFVLKEITSRGGMSAGKKMGYVNNFTKVQHGWINNQRGQQIVHSIMKLINHICNRPF